MKGENVLELIAMIMILNIISSGRSSLCYSVQVYRFSSQPTFSYFHSAHQKLKCSMGRIDLYTPRVPSEPTLSTLWAHNENTKSILRVHSEYIQSTPWVHSEYSPSIFRAPTWAFCMPMCLYWYATQFFRLLLIQSSGFLKDIWRISLEYIWGYLGEIWCWFWWCTLREYMSEHTHVPRHAMVIFKRRVIMMLNFLVGMRLRSTMKIIGRGQSILQLKATAIMSGESIVILNIHK